MKILEPTHCGYHIVVILILSCMTRFIGTFRANETSPEYDTVSSGQRKVREIPDLAKVREKSGNLVEGQGKMNIGESIGKSKGICI